LREIRRDRGDTEDVPVKTLGVEEEAERRRFSRSGPVGYAACRIACGLLAPLGQKLVAVCYLCERGREVKPRAGNQSDGDRATGNIALVEALNVILSKRSSPTCIQAPSA
jgi:hypothetical protein